MIRPDRYDVLTRRRCLGLLLAAGGAGLTGCATPPSQSRFPELTYSHLGQFRLDVARIEIDSQYKSPLAPPNIEHLVPASPEKAMRRWAADRLVATGTPGRYARFVITDAKIVDTPLPKTQGLRGAFTTDQTDRYDASFAAQLEIREERANYRAGEASAWVTRSRTIAEGITLNELDKIRFDLVEATMNDFNAELDRQIHANLGQFLR